MEEEFKPSRQLNPHMQEVVRKEVINLLDACIIYPISDSKWVSPMQIILKRGGMCITRNEQGEEVATSSVTGWRVYIDYRKLNTTVRITFLCHSLIRCQRGWPGGSFTAFQMVIRDTLKLLLLVRIMRKLLLLVRMALLPTDGCLLGYVTPLLHFNVA